ncbi:hypothetical protein HDV00_002388 [Rhizophlyctis rosea]|nr:hypothetical protein HDV00_002388 [Rhizophlyctis rosea]
MEPARATGAIYRELQVREAHILFSVNATANSIRAKLGQVYAITLKSILVYMADIGIVVLLFAGENLFSTTPSASTPGAQTANSDKAMFENALPQNIRRWLILATVILSFILLAWEWRKAWRIIKSNDISYAFTNTVSYRFYVIRSYAHFCFFEQVQNSRKTVDILAFYVFFTFRGWKRLLLAEFPRALLNAFNLVDLFNIKTDCKRDAQGNQILNTANNYAACEKTGANTYKCPCVRNDNSKNFFEFLGGALTDYGNKAQLATTYLTIFSLLLWAISAVQLMIAAGIYIPLLCRIRGNLKEYCCHKIDKRNGFGEPEAGEFASGQFGAWTWLELRSWEIGEVENRGGGKSIGELLRRKSRKRQDQARKAELKDSSKYGRPTLPDVGDLDLNSKPQQYAYYDEYGNSVDPSEVASHYSGAPGPNVGGGGGGYYGAGPGSAYGGSQAGGPGGAGYYPPPPHSGYAQSSFNGSQPRSLGGGPGGPGGPRPMPGSGYASPLPPMPGYAPPTHQYGGADPYARSEYEEGSEYGSERDSHTSHDRSGSAVGGGGVGGGGGGFVGGAGGSVAGRSTPGYSPQYAHTPPPATPAGYASNTSAFRDSLYTTVDGPSASPSPYATPQAYNRRYAPVTSVHTGSSGLAAEYGYAGSERSYGGGAAHRSVGSEIPLRGAGSEYTLSDGESEFGRRGGR